MQSGLLKASGILLLVGGILGIFAALVFIGISIAFLVVDQEIADVAVGAWILIAYLVLGTLMVAGAILSFLASGAAKRGDTSRAFTLGLVGALLPPVQVLPLLGAIFAKVCPEAEGERA